MILCSWLVVFMAIKRTLRLCAVPWFRFRLYRKVSFRKGVIVASIIELIMMATINNEYNKNCRRGRRQWTKICQASIHNCSIFRYSDFYSEPSEDSYQDCKIVIPQSLEILQNHWFQRLKRVSNPCIYRVFNKNCVFPYNFLNFLNSANSAAALVFYLPGVCTHTDISRKNGVRNIY